MLNFGAIDAAGAVDGALAVHLMQRIAMQPRTARHLQDMLQKLIAELEAASRVTR